MMTTKLDKMPLFRCLAFVVAVIVLSLGSTAPAAAWWGDGCPAGFIQCDGGCMPTVNDCCWSGPGVSCRDKCWISNVGPICCPRWQYGTVDGGCANYRYSAKPARLPGEKEGERVEGSEGNEAPTASTPPEKGVPTQSVPPPN
jgi:hypothetical protein